MSDIVVNVFSGSSKEVPVQHKLTGLAVYRDVIMTLLTYGYYPGQVLDLNGERMPLEDPISVPEVNYIEPKEERNSSLRMEYEDTREILSFPYGKESTYQDLENMIIANYGPHHFLTVKKAVENDESWTIVEETLDTNPDTKLCDLFPGVGFRNFATIRKFPLPMSDADQTSVQELP